ncbi:MAG: hypothetical protein HY674_15570, partial [Chloroflexi bacterium]|nr:hypothetical protein [Chloroflexota bacterium]
DLTTATPNLRVFAATSAGLYRSTDGGLTFNKINGGFAHDNVRDIAFASGDANKVFWLALQTTEQGQGGVYRSTDGLSWTEATGDLPLVREGFNLRPHALLAHPLDGTIAYVTLRFGFEFSALYRTRNAGRNWEQLTPDDVVLGWNELWGVWSYGGALSPANPARILLSNEAQPLLSNDGGQTWEQVGTQETAGGTWTGRGVEVTFTYALKEAPGHPQRLYAGYEDIGLWKSEDAGASWSPIFLGLQIGGDIDACAELHVHPSDGDEFYAVASSWSNGLRESNSPSHLLHSADGGNTLVPLTESLALGQGRRGCAAVDFSSPPAARTLLFARHGQSLFRSTNGGATWAASDTGLAAEHRELIFALAIRPDQPSLACAGTHTEFGTYGTSGGVYRSSNGGANWQRAVDYPFSDVHFIGWRGAPRRLFVGGGQVDADDGTFHGALMASDDGGQTFHPVLPQPFVMDVVEMPGAPSTLLAAAGAHYAIGQNQDAGIYRSTDNGGTWERLDLELKHTGLLTLLVPGWDAQRLFVGTRGDGLYADALPTVGGTEVRLAFRLLNETTLELSWPAPAGNYRLQSTDRLEATSAWTSVAAQVELRGDMNVTTLAPERSAQFFRLVKP